MRTDIAFVSINGTRIEIQSSIPDYGIVERRLDDRLTAASRQRLQAYILLHNWISYDRQMWRESGFGYDYDEYLYFELDETGQGDVDARRELLYLLMGEDCEPCAIPISGTN